MRGFIFLVVNLAVSLAFLVKTNGPKIVEIGEDKDIADANKDFLHDDIMEQQNTQRSSVVDDDMLWTSPVPYVLDKDLEMNAKGVTLRAFDQFRLKSCIDFKPRDSENYYINVKKMDGCYSYIGKVQANGQTLSIGRYCDEISTVEHEFLHAFGFYHEQSRYDRDKFVTIAFENIQEGFENNFRKVSDDISTSQGIKYDYMSVMHYGNDAFSNGNGPTILTNDPAFQNVIGQRLEVSPSDVMELNLRYKCDSTVAFKVNCIFAEGNMCGMESCSDSGTGWETVTKAFGGPSYDHTTLPSGNGNHEGNGAGYFVHASTASGQEGDSAWLEMPRMSTNRDCHIQCLQFYYYHSGDESDQLNIWIREFENEQDVKGTRRLMGQITGPQTSHWQLKHISLNAIKHFQVEFEAHKGAGKSSGGFSIDDINLSEIECPHVTLQIDDFEKVLNTSKFATLIQTPRQYSRGGYAYSVGTVLYRSYFGVFAQLLSGKYDDQLKWPCPQRQVTFQMLDQNPNIKLQMSKQRSITSDDSVTSDGTSVWGNPRETENVFGVENNETIYGGPLTGRGRFMTVEDLKSRGFLKGGSAVFVFSFQDLTPLVNGNALPCPKMGPVIVTHQPTDPDKGPCSSRVVPTTIPPPETTDDDSVFGFSPGLVACPVLTLLVAFTLLIP